MRSSIARSLAPRRAFTDSTQATRPARWARKSSWPSRLCVAGPSRRQLWRMASSRSSSSLRTLGVKGAGAAREIGPARERQIVRVPRVPRPPGAGRRREPHVEAERGQVREGGRRRSPLRQVRRAVEPSRPEALADLGGGPRRRQARPCRGGGRRGGEPREQPGDGLGVSERAEEREDPRRTDGGEEARHVEDDHDLGPGVERGVREDRAAPPEPVGRVVRRHVAQRRARAVRVASEIPPGSPGEVLVPPGDGPAPA
jgi:hypothetical protein